MIRGRARNAVRLRETSDIRRPRQLAFAALGAAIGVATFAALAPRGSLTTPGPLSASHANAGLKCASCHDVAASETTRALASGIADKARIGTDACRSCHGDHSLRGGHERATAKGALACATCHPAHGSEAVRFGGDGHAAFSTPTGTRIVDAPPIASGVTVPLMRTSTCNGCHDARNLADPLHACVDASGQSSPPLVVRCLGEHDATRSGKACATQHVAARFAARDAATRVASGSSLAAKATSAGSVATWLGLGPIALGLVAYAGARAARRKRASGAATAPVPTITSKRRLPVIDASRCLGCYACVDACAFDVLAVERYVAKVERPDACCGAVTCEAACPNGSLVMREVDDADAGSRGGGHGPAGAVALSDALEADVRPGVFMAGDVTGVPLIRNAVLHGRRAIDGAMSRKKRLGPSAKNDVDVLVLGAGPAGLAASLRAQEFGLSYVTLEQHAVAASIKSFPRGKLVFDAPLELPLEGELFTRECTKEELVLQWARIVRSRQPRILEGHRAVGVETKAGGDGFMVTYERTDGSRGALSATSLVIAIGQRGTPRKLEATVDADAESMVSDALFDARSFAGKRVIIVGLGDSAMEAAQALAHQPGTHVTLVHRGGGFDRGRARNIEETRALVDAGRVELRLRSRVLRVAPGRVTLEGEGGADELLADAVLALLGGVPSSALLEQLGLLPGAPKESSRG